MQDVKKLQAAAAMVYKTRKNKKYRTQRKESPASTFGPHSIDIGRKHVADDVNDVRHHGFYEILVVW
jgi:hypothetical protein